MSAGKNQNEQPGQLGVWNEVTPDEKSHHYLLFKLSSERFACPLLQIKEVVRVPQIKALPHQVKFLKGIVNLKGQVLSVMDLKMRLSISSTVDPDAVGLGEKQKDPLMFIVVSKGVHIGIIVDSAEAVVHIPPENIETPLSLHPNIPMDFLLGVGKIETESVHILDLERLVSELIPKSNTSLSDRNGKSK